MDNPNYDKLREVTKPQIETGKFLESLEPILKPFEDLSKHGISLSTAFLGFTAAILSIFAPTSLKVSYENLLLFLSWLMFVFAIGFGIYQLWLIASFREQMRDFSYVLMGSVPDKEEKAKANKIVEQSYKSSMIKEYLFLCVGIILFCVWALTKGHS